MKHRSCAEAQGDGVPCLSVRVACDECVRARPVRKRLRRKPGATEAVAVPEKPVGESDREPQSDDTH
jgi:hypothetical protein